MPPPRCTRPFMPGHTVVSFPPLSCPGLVAAWRPPPGHFRFRYDCKTPRLAAGCLAVRAQSRPGAIRGFGAEGFENPLRRNTPGRGQIAFRPWIDCLPAVVRLPSVRGQIAFRPWTGCLPSMDRLSSVRGQVAFRPWIGCLPSVDRLSSVRGLATFQPWTGCLPAVNRSLCFRSLPRAKPILR